MADPLPVVREAAITRSRAPVYLPRRLPPGVPGLLPALFLRLARAHDRRGDPPLPRALPAQLDPLSALVRAGLVVAASLRARGRARDRRPHRPLRPGVLRLDLPARHAAPRRLVADAAAPARPAPPRQPLASPLPAEVPAARRPARGGARRDALHRPPRPGLARHPLVRLRPPARVLGGGRGRGPAAAHLRRGLADRRPLPRPSRREPLGRALVVPGPSARSAPSSVSAPAPRSSASTWIPSSATTATAACGTARARTSRSRAIASPSATSASTASPSAPRTRSRSAPSRRRRPRTAGSTCRALAISASETSATGRST